MRLYEIKPGKRQKIKEAPGDKEPVDDGKLRAEILVPLIRKNCSQALAGMYDAGTFIYRGVKGSHIPQAFFGQSRTDRTPSSSSGPFHRNIDRAFAMAGFTANRTNSLFATSNYGDAAIYGRAYMIFPIDGFQFTWSPRINDLYVDEYRKWGSDPDSFTMRSDFYNHDDASPELCKEFLSRFDYRNTDFAAAVKSGNEIMISGSYYAVLAQQARDYPEFRALLGATT